MEKKKEEKEECKKGNNKNKGSNEIRTKNQQRLFIALVH